MQTNSLWLVSGIPNLVASAALRAVVLLNGNPHVEDCYRPPHPVRRDFQPPDRVDRPLARRLGAHLGPQRRTALFWAVRLELRAFCSRYSPLILILESMAPPPAGPFCVIELLSHRQAATSCDILGNARQPRDNTLALWHITYQNGAPVTLGLNRSVPREDL